MYVCLLLTRRSVGRGAAGIDRLRVQCKNVGCSALLARNHLVYTAGHIVLTKHVALARLNHLQLDAQQILQAGEDLHLHQVRLVVLLHSYNCSARAQLQQ